MGSSDRAIGLLDGDPMDRKVEFCGTADRKALPEGHFNQSFYLGTGKILCGPLDSSMGMGRQLFMELGLGGDDEFGVLEMEAVFIVSKGSD